MYGSHDAQESVRLIIAIQSAHDAKNDENLATVLEETCTLICVGGEGFVRSLDTQAYIGLFAELLGHKKSDISLLSMRAIALMADTVPKACNVLVSLDLIPVLLHWVKKKQYLATNLGFSEELLKCLEILSLEAHKPMLKNNAVSLLIALTSVLKEKLRYSALCCVSNLISACRPQDLALVEISIPHLNGLLMEQLSADGVRFKDTALTARVCVCFAHILDRITVNERLMERLLGGEGRSLVPNMVSVLQYANQSQEPLLLRRSALGVLSTMFSSSPATALKEFLHHHVFQGVCSAMLDLVTANEDRLKFDSMHSEGGARHQEVSPPRHQHHVGASSGHEEKNRIGDSLPLLSQEQNCVLLLDFLLYVTPRAQGTMDEFNITLPHHGWQWEDDFHNHNEYDDEQAKKLEEEYQRQQISKRFKPFEIFQGTRSVAVDFEHLRFLNSHGGLSRPFFRSPVPSYFFHRRANLLQERCKCFRIDSDQETIVSDRGSIIDIEERDADHVDSDSEAGGCFAKFKGCLCGGSEDETTTSNSAGGDDTPVFNDLREEKLLNPANRVVFNQPETMRVVLSTMVPSLLSLVFSVVNPVVVRHVSVLLLRCLSLTREFVRKHGSDFGPKALEVLVLEAPTITQAVVMMLNAVNVEVGPRLAITSIIQVKLDKSTELGALLHAGPTLTSNLSTQGETLVSSLENCSLLVDLLGEKAIQLLSSQGAAPRLKSVGASLQLTLDGISEEDNRLLGASRSNTSYSNASAFVGRHGTSGVIGSHNSFVNMIASRAEQAEGSVGDSNTVVSPVCPLHIPRSRWLSDALTLQQRLLKHLTNSQQDISLKVEDNPLAIIPQVSTPHSRSGHESLNSVHMMSMSSNLSDSEEPMLLESPSSSSLDIEELDCWEVLVKVNSALANDELSLEAVQNWDPRAICVLAKKLREDWRLHFSSMSQLRHEGECSSSSIAPASSLASSWIPHASVATAHNLAHSLAQRVGRYVDLAGSHATDNVHSVLQKSGRGNLHSGKGVVGSTPFALQMMEDRLIRPLSLRLSSYEIHNLDASFSGSSRSLKPSSYILMEGKQLPTVNLTREFEDNLLCLPFATIFALESEVLRRVLPYLDVPNGSAATDPGETRHWTSSTGGGYSAQAEMPREPSREERRSLHVVLFVNGIPLRSPTMTLLDALCTYSASALSLRRLLEAPLTHHRQNLSKALSIWLSQHPIQFAVVSTPPPLETRHLAQLGCSCEYRKPHYCTPMHHYTLAREKNSDHILTHSLEILHLLLPAIRKPGQLVPGALRKMYSSVIHDLHSQSSTFLVPALAPLCHMVTQTDRLEATLATYALWNYPQVFPLSLRIAVFTLTMSTGSVLATRALNSTVLLQRNQIVGAEWSAHSHSTSQQLMNFPQMMHSPFMMAQGAAPKKLKLAIDRENILEEARDVLETFASCPAPYDVEFKGEPGSGLGPTLEFFSLVGAAIVQADGLWVKRSDGFLVPSYPLPPSKLELLELLGALIGRCLKEKRQIDVHLHPVFWATILGNSVTSDATSSSFLDVDIERSLSQIKNLTETDLHSADLRWTVPGTELPLLPGGEHTIVTSDNRGSYIEAIKAHYARNRLTQPAEALSRGIQRVFSPCHLRLFNTEEIAYLLSGPRGRLWNSPQEVANDIICAHGYTISSKPVQFLIQTVGEWDETHQRKFLLFISGSECVPLGGLQPKITVVRKDVEATEQQSPAPNGTLSPAPSDISGPASNPLARNGSQQSFDESPAEKQSNSTPSQGFSPLVEVNPVDSTLPTVNTCFHYLKLPEYTSLESLGKQLTYAVNEGQDSFGLS